MRDLLMESDSGLRKRLVEELDLVSRFFLKDLLFASFYHQSASKKDKDGKQDAKDENEVIKQTPTRFGDKNKITADEQRSYRAAYSLVNELLADDTAEQ